MTDKTYFHELWEPKYDIKLKIGQRLLYSFLRFLSKLKTDNQIFIYFDLI